MNDWIVESLGVARIDRARTEAVRRLLSGALPLSPPQASKLVDEELEFILNGLELVVFDALDDEARIDELRYVSADAFRLMRVLPRPRDPLMSAKHCLRLACLGVLGERGADAARLLREDPWPGLPLQSHDWGVRTCATIVDVWLRLIRKDGWQDLRIAQADVLALRQVQQEYETGYLEELSDRARSGAWELIALYHLAKAAELLAAYTTQGIAEGGFDIRVQLHSQFDRAKIACARAELIELDNLVRLLARAAGQLVDNCIWTVTRAVNSRVTQFVESLVARGQNDASDRPLFEMLPPQRRALREAGLLGSGFRSVVVNLPTSSGKTLIAEFRILQALNQFDDLQGWVAYLAPTRALVNQVFVRLRKDFADLGINVERVSPALEVDGLEARLLTDVDPRTHFRILVTTPEKLDLMLRGGWEAKINRPLTLVVVDEAHTLGTKTRGIKLELLLSTINKECRQAQFLLLTPFIDNAAEVARWLAPESYQDIDLGLIWQPNDRAIVLSKPCEGARRGGFSLELETLHTNKETLAVPESLHLYGERLLGFNHSDVRNNASKLAAATAQVLKARGPVIVLAGKVSHTWSLAAHFKHEANREASPHEEVRLVQRFLKAELGEDFALAELLDYGVGVHHAGLPDEVRVLMEWLLEREHIRVLVATTTIAQGVNFPVSGVVLAAHQYPYGTDMPPEDFWNLAGRAGRVNQGSLGIVALAAIDEKKAAKLRDFVGRQVLSLNSSLIDMVQKVLDEGHSLELHTLFNRPEWSAFLQYLVHTYRQIGDPDRFTAEIERILGGTLGFESLRRQQHQSAYRLLDQVHAYGRRLAEKSGGIGLVDSTGFSLEAVQITLGKLKDAQIKEDVWDSERLFGGDIRPLQKMMGILLGVPELHENLAEATGGRGGDGDMLAHMVRDWVAGASLPEMADEYFLTDAKGKSRETTAALTECCRNVFGKLIQTTSWGLAALQTMTFGDRFDSLSETDRQSLRNLPARVFYGVNTDDAIALRLLGIPRNAARALGSDMSFSLREQSLPCLRAEIAQKGGEYWARRMGESGHDYFKIWHVLEGLV